MTSLSSSSPNSCAAITYSQSSLYSIMPRLNSAKNARAAAILPLRRRCAQSLWRIWPSPVVCPEYSSEPNGMSRNAKNASTISVRALLRATRTYAADGDTATSAWRREGDAASSISSMVGGPPPPPPSFSLFPSAPNDPFISDSSRRCQGSLAMAPGASSAAGPRALVLAKRALRIAVLPTRTPVCLPIKAEIVLSGMFTRHSSTKVRQSEPIAVPLTDMAASALVTAPQSVHVTRGMASMMQAPLPLPPPSLRMILPRRSMSRAPSSTGSSPARSSLPTRSHILL